jgi:NAD-dependent dihydropyrimidine dehydrogenase PreA subunit
LCEFCTKHGEGKKWYEVMDNYSAELLSDKSRQKYINKFLKSIRTNTQPNIKRLKWTKERLPFAYKFIRKVATASMKNNHYGQVVPLEDAEKIVDMVQSITRISCVCRNVTTGKDNARYCLLLGIDPTGCITDWPELEASLETLTRDKAKKLLREFDQQGLVHSIWTLKTPFIASICNCDQNCLAYKIQIDSDLLNLMFKGEYFAEIDPFLCVGCRSCQKECQFDAIEFSAANKKCYINPLKCYGCGLCRNPCKKDAITLLEKKADPAI